MKASSRFHSVLMFLVFVVVAAVFWFIIALNDNVTDTFRVKLQIQNIPDSVTFITDPPADFHVTLRDKGTNIVRSGFVKNPVVSINFADYARDGVLVIRHSEILSEIKSDLGAAAQITSCSLDSLKLYYSTEPGKRVPVEVLADVSAASGYVISGNPVPSIKSVLIYSYRDEVDTVVRVHTQRLVKRNLSSSSSFKVNLAKLQGIRIIPSTIDVKVNVEPLVHKESFANIEIDNVPPGENLLLFPGKVEVSYYVPMSKFNDESMPVVAHVDYLETKINHGSKIPVTLKFYPKYVVNPELKTDSVEYTLVK